MRPTAAGIYPFIPSAPNASLQGDASVATPHAPNQNAQGIIATVRRAKDDEASKRTASANANEAEAQSANFSSNLNHAHAAASYAAQTSARFLTPDSLLSKLDKAKVDQLRAREEAIKKETGELDSADAAGLSFIYDHGPDGRKYIVGVATPLVLQNAPPAQEEDALPPLPDHQQARAFSAYQQRAGSASPFRAGLIDQAY